MLLIVKMMDDSE